MYYVLLYIQGAWKWSDGTALDYTHWGPNEPDGNTNNDCMDMSESQTWSDYDCGPTNYPKPYICKL